jgi:hypothetical protein
MKYNPNLAVFTTNYIMNNNSPIVYVVHDNDDWQFLGPEEDINESNLMIVKLQSLINLDQSIIKILHIENGFEAYRDNINTDWKIVSMN